MIYSVREATLSDIDEILPNLRKEDIAELKAASGQTPGPLLTEALNTSQGLCWVITVDESVVAMCGLTESPFKGVGIPWAVATPEIEKHSIGMLRASKALLRIFHSHYPKLVNFVDARNKTHIRWLQWLGFEFIRLHEEYGVARIPFWEFTRKRRDYV